MQWSGHNEISLRNNLEDTEVAVKKPRLRVRQGKPGCNEISLRNNLEDAEVAVKMPRLRVRQGKPGCNGRDAMRFHRVIILFETVSCLKPVARRGGFGNRGPPRGVMRSDAMNCGPSPGLSRQPQARREAEEDTLSALAHHLPVKICISVTSLPAFQDLHSRARRGRRVTRLTPIKKHRGRPSPGFLTSPRFQ